MKKANGCDIRVSNGSFGYSNYKYYGSDDTGKGLAFHIDSSISRCYVYIRVEKGVQVRNETFFPVLYRTDSGRDKQIALEAESEIFDNIRNQSVTLYNGIRLPMISLGTYGIGKSKELEKQTIKDSLSFGYRMIDTASSYMTEDSVGKALKEAEIDGICERKDVIVVSKMKSTSMMNYHSAKNAIDSSLNKLGLKYIDLYLLHQAYGDYFSAWRAVEDAYIEGKVKAVGVCNFYPGIFANFCETVKIRPMVNQVETHPFFVQEKSLETIRYYDAVPMAWAPLGGGRYGIYDNEKIAKIAYKYKKSIAQIVLRWNIQRGVVVIPKSSHVERIKENLNIWDFSLSPEEMEVISSFDRGYTGERIKHLTPEFVRARLGKEF